MNKKLITLIPVFIFFVFGVVGMFLLNNYRNKNIALPNGPTITPTVIFNNCGIENCHGLNIVCGTNVAEVCTMMYQIGDKCRQYATCGVVNGACVQIENVQFITCKACVEQCINNYPNDPDKAFNCENECGE